MANIELDGANKKIKVDSGDLTLDVPGDIILDADGADVVFADGGTNILKVTNSSSDVVFQPQVDAKDIIFKQYDGTTVATIEDNGTLNVPTGKLAINATAITSTAAELNLIDGGTARGTTAIADGDGVLINDAGTMRMTTVETLKTYIGGADPSSADGDSLGTASLEWSDLYLADGGIIYFGNDQDVTLTHDPDDGLFLKSIATGDDNPVLLTLQTGETDLAANDVIGKIAFQAPDEGTGTDAILVSGAIQAVAEGDHSSSSNATSLEFMTGASEAATTKIKITSAGHLVPATDNTSDLGTSSLEFKDGYFDGTLNADKIAMTVTNDAPNASGTTRVGTITLDGSNNGIFEMGLADGSFYAWLQATDKTDLSVNYPLALNGNGGKVWMGTTSELDSDSTLQVKSNTNGGEAITAQVHTNGNSVVNFNNASSNECGYIAVAANGSAVSYSTSSDYRLKENEVAISDGITRLKTLKPYKFNFKTKPDVKVDGFFAHEVTAVPEAITGEKDGEKMQGIDQSKLVPLLTAALQESITKIESLEARVKTLEDA